MLVPAVAIIVSGVMDTSTATSAAFLPAFFSSVTAAPHVIVSLLCALTVIFRGFVPAGR